MKINLEVFQKGKKVEGFVASHKSSTNTRVIDFINFKGNLIFRLVYDTNKKDFTVDKKVNEPFEIFLNNKYYKI